MTRLAFFNRRKRTQASVPQAWYVASWLITVGTWVASPLFRLSLWSRSSSSLSATATTGPVIARRPYRQPHVTSQRRTAFTPRRQPHTAFARRRLVGQVCPPPKSNRAEMTRERVDPVASGLHRLHDQTGARERSLVWIGRVTRRLGRDRQGDDETSSALSSRISVHTPTVGRERGITRSRSTLTLALRRWQFRAAVRSFVALGID
jgi:hypothetical protein